MGRKVIELEAMKQQAAVNWSRANAMWPMLFGPALLFALTFTFACALLPGSLPPDAIPTAVAGTLTAQIPSPPPTSEPTQAPIATISEIPIAFCPAPGTPPPIVFPGTFTDLAASVLAYLNAGGSIPDLNRTLSFIGAGSDSGAVLQADLTGDGTPEVIASLIDKTVESMLPTPPGQLFIFACQDGRYVQSYASDYTQPPEFSLPKIFAIQDVTNDGRAEALYTREQCGAHTCHSLLAVIGWNGKDFVNWVNGETLLASASTMLQMGEGGARIEMHGGAVGSVGAGPSRTFTNLWMWNGSAIALAETILDPPVYRYHALTDADAVAKDDYERALLLYQRVLDDETLREWEGQIPDERVHLESYARFRIMALHLLKGNSNAGQIAYNDLKAQHPVGTPGGEFAPVADAFWRSYSQTTDVHSACGEAVAYVNANPATLETLNSFGYANRTYVPQDVCPF